jgi:hypothetical protein
MNRQTWTGVAGTLGMAPVGIGEMGSFPRWPLGFPATRVTARRPSPRPTETGQIGHELVHGALARLAMP